MRKGLYALIGSLGILIGVTAGLYIRPKLDSYLLSARINNSSEVEDSNSSEKTTYTIDHWDREANRFTLIRDEDKSLHRIEYNLESLEVTMWEINPKNSIEKFVNTNQ